MMRQINMQFADSFLLFTPWLRLIEFDTLFDPHPTFNIMNEQRFSESNFPLVIKAPWSTLWCGTTLFLITTPGSRYLQRENEKDAAFIKSVYRHFILFFMFYGHLAFLQGFLLLFMFIAAQIFCLRSIQIETYLFNFVVSKLVCKYALKLLWYI